MIEYILSIQTQDKINAKVNADLVDDKLHILDPDKASAQNKINFIDGCVRNELSQLIDAGYFKQLEHEQDILIKMKFCGNLCHRKYTITAKSED